METFLGKGLNDLANLVSDRWYAGVGLVGLMILMWTLLIGTPHDDMIIGAIGIAMIGFGFGEGETRTFLQRVDHAERFVITNPVRRWNGPSIFLYSIGTFSALFAMLRYLY